MNRIHREVWDRHDGEMGFSLIALLVVLLTLGAMSAIAVAVVNTEKTTLPQGHEPVAGPPDTPGSNTSLANRAVCEASAQAIETAALAYFVGNDGTWPADIATLTDATPPYLEGAPDPTWGLVLDHTNGQVDETVCAQL